MSTVFSVWDGIVAIFNAIMTPLYYGVSALLVGWHAVLSPIFGADSGWTWALSIAGLTIVIRTLLIPLFVKQIRSSRNLQLLQPQMKELQKKYGHDRERLGQEMMKLYKETGTNPLSSCLPLLLQSPIFLALFRVLDGASKGQAHSSIIEPYIESLRHATIFGAEISATFLKASGPNAINVKIVAMVLIILMTTTMFITQLQLMRKNMPKAALEGQAAQMQKIMLYVFPVFFLIGGFNFPIGVLIYWFVSNLWTMGQQFYVIRRNPAPGTPAYDAMEARKREHAVKHGKPVEGEAAADGTVAVEDQPRPVIRQQPKRQSRSARKGPASPTPSGGAAQKTTGSGSGSAQKSSPSGGSGGSGTPKASSDSGARKSGSSKADIPARDRKAGDRPRNKVVAADSDRAKDDSGSGGSKGKDSGTAGNSGANGKRGSGAARTSGKRGTRR
jgi:YidC/Oxa1 family membrane protein insertase